VFYVVTRFTPMLLRAAVVATMTTIVGACASSGAKTTAHRADCGLSDADAVFAVGGPVYHDCAVDRAAHVTANVQSDYRPTPSRTTCYSADVEFVVDTAGKPETRTARVIRTNDQQFAESLLASLARWKYDPASRDGRLVRQIVVTHQAISATVVRVPAGAPPPSTSSVSQRPPSC
jgi:hypothetical protein